MGPNAASSTGSSMLVPATDERSCFISASEAVIISNPDYLSADTPTIDSKEFSILKRNENKIRYDFSKYVRQYKP